MPQSVIRSSRSTLVALSEEHLQHEVVIDADPAVMRYLGDRPARTREQGRGTPLPPDRRSSARAGLGFWAGFVGRQFVGWWILEPVPDQFARTFACESLLPVRRETPLARVRCERTVSREHRGPACP